MRILLDLRKPLARGRTVMLQDVKTWIPIQYEKLPRFCMQCGRVIHDKLGCPSSSAMKTGSKQFGSWLRAEAGGRKFKTFASSGSSSTWKKVQPEMGNQVVEEGGDKVDDNSKCNGGSSSEQSIMGSRDVGDTPLVLRRD